MLMTRSPAFSRWARVALLVTTGLCAGVQAAPVPVQSAPLAKVATYPLREVMADVQARNLTDIRAEVNATVLTWRADAGERVRRGQLLAELDGTDLRLTRDQAQAQLRTASAQLELAQLQLQRAQALAQQGFYSTEALNQANTQVKVLGAQVAAARVQLRLAQRQLDKTQIKAPFDGEIIGRQAQRGAQVSPGTSLFTLSETRAAQLSAQLTPQQARELQRAREAQWVGAGQTIRLSAQQWRLTSSLDTRTRAQTIRATLGAEVAPGSQGRLQWRAPQPHLDAQWLVRRDGRLGVFLVDQGRARFHALAGAQEGQAAPVDLPATTMVVTVGQQRLQDGDAVDAKP